MPLADPVPGWVLRCSYPWLRERDEGETKVSRIVVPRAGSLAADPIGHRWDLEYIMVGKVEAYAALGAALKNERWAWSGHSGDETKVVVTLWDDKLRPVPGGVRYDIFDAPDLDAWRAKRGNRERIRDLVLARDRCDGLFGVVMGRANETGDAMLDGSVYEAAPDITMRLIDLDETTGEFSAESVDRGSVARIHDPSC